MGRRPDTVQAYNACSEVRGPEAHRESARSGGADNGEDAEVDSALPRRRYVVRDHGLLLGLGVVLLLGLGSVLDLDLERAELVVPSKDVILPKRGREGRAEDFSLLWSAVGCQVRRKAWVSGHEARVRAGGWAHVASGCGLRSTKVSARRVWGVRRARRGLRRVSSVVKVQRLRREVALCPISVAEIK